MYVRLRRRSSRKGLGALALGGAVLIPLVCVLLAATASSHAAAPALVGGGGAMVGLLLGRWGLGEFRSHAKR